MQASEQDTREPSSMEKILREIKWLRNRHDAFVDFVEQHHPELIELWKVQQALELYKR
jgi:hypothetical protein